MVFSSTAISRKKAILVILIFWLSLGLLYYFMPVLEDVMKRQEIQWGRYLIFNLQWIIWSALTPLMILLAKKYKIEETAIFTGILKHLAIAAGLICFEFIIEFFLQHFLMEVIYHQPRSFNNFLYFVLYKFHTYIILYFLIVFVVNALENLNKYKAAVQQKAEMQSQLVTAQIQSLKGQIQPHFLFNTHNTIMSLILKNENEKAIKMLTGLSRLLRKSLDNSDKEFCPLENEIATITDYLDIHKIRFEDRLKVQYNIDKNAEHCLVPAFILQPLVENAILHGISPYVNSGLIEVNAFKKNDLLTIEIKDDGETDGKYNEERIGMANTRKRLTTLFGVNNFSFGLKKNENKGSTTHLTIPTGF